MAEADLDAFIEQKINGKVERVRVRDLQKSFGLDKTANQRMQEAAQMRKQAEQLSHLMRTDFAKYCEVTGQDPNQFLRQQLQSRKELAEEVLAKEYERQQLSPEARELQDTKAELERVRQVEAQRKQPLIAEIKKVVPESMLPKGLENASAEQLQNFLQVKQQEFRQGVDNLSNELLQAWQENGLPRDKFVGQLMAMHMSDHQKRTGEALQAKDAAVKVKARFLDSTRSILAQMDAKAIQETLGEAIIQKLREYDVAQVRGTDPQFGSQQAPTQPSASEPKKYMNQQEWRKAHGLA